MAAEPMHDVRHIGRVELMTPKPAESLAFFRDVLGMEVVQEEGGAAWLRGYGDDAVSTLKLTASRAAGVGTIAWRADSPAALERRAAALDAAGLGRGWSNGDLGHGRTFRFRDPDGHAMAIYYEEERYAAPPALRSSLKNLPMRYTGRGVCVRRLDHLALLCRDVAANRGFAEGLLGFQLREQVRFRQGEVEIGSWLSPSPVHHELAYVLDVKGGAGRLHHCSFWVDDRTDVLRAADLLSEHGIAIEAGPARHNNSQGFFLYCFEPGGNRIEVYAGSFLVFAPDWRVVTWDERERAGGVYWGGKLPASFLHYGTPDIRDGAAADVPVFDPV